MKNILKNINLSCKTIFATSILASTVSTYADDTEVFYSVNVSKPNLLFVLDNSGSMNSNLPGGTQSKLSVLQESVEQVLNSAPDNVNIGLMRFGPGLITNEWNTANEGNRTHGVSGVAFPLTDLNAKARDIIPTNDDVYGLGVFPSEEDQVRTYVSDVVDNWTASGGTPLVGALYEAALYFRGERMRYGYDSPSGGTGVGAHPSTYDGLVINNDILNNTRNYDQAPTYKTPIKSSCQANYIVLMSDGSPTYYYNGAANTQGAAWSESRGPFANIMQGNAGFSNLAAAVPNCVDTPNGFAAGKCGPELTGYIATHDNLASPSAAFPDGQDGDQFIKTFTIGFGTGAGTNTEGYLKSLATYDDDNPATDDDGYYLATNPEELAAAFANILSEVSEPKGTLASPGYSVNVKNGLEHEKDIFIPVFDRKNTSRWSGNLKKFKLVDVGDKRIIRGKNDLDATDEIGNFTPSALDYWSSSPNSNPDGSNVHKGGVANLLDPDTRKIFSNLTGNSNVTLNTNANKLHLNNISNLSNTVLGLPDDASLDYRKRVVSFMRGWKNGITNTSTTPPPEKRYHMGDMLHSEPLVMTYNKGSGADQTGKQQYIFAGTNEGYMHAFDAETGEEKFAFIPAELLKTITEPQFLNAGTQRDHLYGIDGSITGDFIGGQDGIVNDGDQIIIYFGLRRGGTSYYALDVTDIDNPKLLWKKSVTDHPSMGQSWATPYVATVGNSNGNGQSVVIVSGGYDEDEDRDKSDGSGEVDDSTAPVTANVGNDVLIFDSQNGNLVWSMTSEMRAQITSSIAGGVRPLDTNGNKLIDRIYFGDTGGNVWRLDLSEKIGDADQPTTLTKLASLAGTGSNARKFFNEPDVALMKLKGKSVYAVSIGSGFRAHPMDAVINDKFYVLIDSSPYKSLVTEGDNPFTTITQNKLARIDISATGEMTQTGSIQNPNKRGWVVSLPENGEKVLSDATAINGSIIFGTLVPEVLDSDLVADQCAAPATYSRLYAIDILTGTSKWDLDDDGVPEPFTEPLTSEIISSVDKVFNTPEPESSVVDDNGQPTGEFDSVYWSDPVDAGE